MFPWIYEFHWTAGHLIFLGAFFTVLTVISVSVALAVRRSAGDLAAGRVAAIRWHALFDELPGTAKRCRHELTGELRARTCPHGFDCGECELHPLLLERRAQDEPPAAGAVSIRGIDLPLDRFYHRTHTWVRPEGDGSCTIGLDPFASRIIGAPDEVSLPGPGARAIANAPLCELRKGGHPYPVLSPVGGTVEASGTGADGWWVRLRTDAPPESCAHLLRGAEIAPWIGREMERIEMLTTGAGGTPSLADGGELLPELGGQFDPAAMDDIRATVLMSE
jgi:glycine cleavage system H protein